jgi:hypothetical protein
MDFKKLAGSIARHATTALGALLVAKGVPPQFIPLLTDPINQQLAGGLLYLGGQLWSFYNKLPKRIRF